MKRGMSAGSGPIPWDFPSRYGVFVVEECGSKLAFQSPRRAWRKGTHMVGKAGAGQGVGDD